MGEFDQKSQQVKNQANIGAMHGNIGQFGDIISDQTVNIRQEIIAKRTITNRQAVRPHAGYVHREEVEQSLRELILSPSDEMKRIFLTGLPRSGVSTVAQSIAAELETEFPDGTLWADVQKATKEEILWRFIQPFDQTVDRAALTDAKLYRETLGNLLRDKRVLIVLDHVQKMADVDALTPDGCPDAVVLVASRVGLPGVLDEKNHVHVSKLTQAEAEQLFHTVWAADPRLQDVTSDIILELAEMHHFMPADMIIAARDILTTQVPPRDYLADLRDRLQSPVADSRSFAPLFGALFDRLPEQAQQLLPYLGVLGGSWDIGALTTVSPIKRHAVQVGIRQLESRLLVVSQTADSYSSESIIREFALAKLYELGGENLVWASRKLAADYYLNATNQILNRSRQEIFNDFLQDEIEREKFSQAVAESINQQPYGYEYDVDPDVLDSTLGSSVSFDLIQEKFEDIVLANPSFSERWNEVIESEKLRAMRQYLGQALDWAVEQEDWLLVQRYTKLGSAPGSVSIEGATDIVTWLQEFSVIRNSNLTSANLITVFYATRFLNSHFTSCKFLSAKWFGVEIRSSDFTEIDLVGAEMPGLIVINSHFTDIDARMADLRGAIFYRCHFTELNARMADLRGAIFYRCYFTSANFQNAKQEDTVFVNCFMTDVDMREFRIRRD